MVYGIALRYVLQIYFMDRLKLFSDSSRGLRGARAAGSIPAGSKDGGAQRAVPRWVGRGSADGGRPFMRVVRAPTLAMTLASTSIIIHRGTGTPDDRQPTGDLRRSVFAAGAPGVFRTHAPGGPQKHASLSLVSYRYSVRT